MPVGEHSEPRVNLNEKHEREAYIGRVARSMEHQLQKELIRDLVADNMGLNDPYKFHMVQYPDRAGLFLPYRDEGWPDGQPA